MREITGAATAGALGELQAHRFFYLYLAIGTSVAFSSFGFVLGLFADRLVAANAKLRGLAVTDALTSLRNARYFLDVLPTEAARADRQNQPFALVMIDLDNFKRINDRFGHAAGDRALVHFAGVLSGCIRKVDIACRIGGEEFAVICPGAGLDDARRVAERILAVHTPGRHCAELSLAADAALYAAKRSGKDQVAMSRQALAMQGPAITGTDGR